MRKFIYKKIFLNRFYCIDTIIKNSIILFQTFILLSFSPLNSFRKKYTRKMFKLLHSLSGTWGVSKSAHFEAYLCTLLYTRWQCKLHFNEHFIRHFYYAECASEWMVDMLTKKIHYNFQHPAIYTTIEERKLCILSFCRHILDICAKNSHIVKC